MAGSAGNKNQWHFQPNQFIQEKCPENSNNFMYLQNWMTQYSNVFKVAL